jgi:hypothetical protein
MNRLRTDVLAQGVFVWRGAGRPRIFRDEDVRLDASTERVRCRPVFKVPRVMALLSPDQAPDVPAQVEIAARAATDAVEVRFDAATLSQVVIPSETGPSITIINEAVGRVIVTGTIRGEAIRFAGRAVCEFLSC